MTEHLPECPEVYIECFGGICDCEYSHVCICTALRACEERVIATAVQRVEALKPQLWITKRDGGYDCCGCNTLDELYEDCIDAIKGDSDD